MAGIRAMGIFCEDIREETLGLHSLVGIYRDNVHVLRVPTMLPKLGIYVRIGIPADADVRSAAVLLVHADGKEQQLTEIDPSLVAQAKAECRGTDMPFGTVMSKAVIAPFSIRDRGRIKLIVRSGGESLVCATLNFQVPQAPAGDGRDTGADTRRKPAKRKRKDDVVARSVEV